MMQGQARHAVFIEPSSEHYLENRLFDVSDKHLNRDGTLLPFARLRDTLRQQGVEVQTADYLRRGEGLAELNHYWSIGLLNGYQEFIGRQDVRLRGFILFEPPLVAPRMYRALPQLTQVFEEVYLHNTVGDAYPLNGVDTSRLRKLYWPQPYSDVVEPYWSRTDRLNKAVVISGNHNPGFRHPELYSKRIEGMSALSEIDAVDLYGRGWDRWWSRQSLWWPYWKHRRELMSIYRGPCDSKLETLSRYRFCLCFENMPMTGYLTEKLFDCLYAGTLPIYFGAPDINKLIPEGGYINITQSDDWITKLKSLSSMSENEWLSRRKSGLSFIKNKKFIDYYESLLRMINV